MIRSIRALAAKLRGKQQQPHISAADAARLRALTSYDEWDAYQRMLEATIEQYAEAMLTSSDASQLHYLRGLIVGLREATLFAERIAASTQPSAQKPDARSTERFDRRRLALYATPAWPGSDVAS